jgi:hypothetical protein
MSMMMAFMFNLMGASLSFWETGNRRMEAAQAARVGLNIIAKDLENALAGNMTSYTSSGNATYNIAPFFARSSSNASVTGTLTDDAIIAEGSDQLFGISLTGDPSDPFEQFGYQCVFVTKDGGFDNMRNRFYYLVRQNVPDAMYFKNAPPGASWYNNTGSSSNYPIIDNCIRLTFEYYGDPNLGNASDPAFSPVWSTTWTPANPTHRLPLGVLVTATVLDSRTGDKIAALSSSPLSAADITAGIDAANGNGSTSNNIQRLISQGAVTVRRFIPLNPG